MLFPELREMSKRNYLFLLFLAAASLMGYGPMRDLLANPIRSEYYSHILLIPFVSGFLIYLQRNKIHSQAEYDLHSGSIVALSGFLLSVAGIAGQGDLNVNDYASLNMFAVILMAVGGFIAIYGKKAFRSVRFPLGFLVFMIPIPKFLMDEIIHILQAGSAEITDWLFLLTGMPAYRSGFHFQLPGVVIEVAKECSGIRSSLGLLITSVLAAHLFLQKRWKKTLFIVAVLPVSILKNGIRILTLSVLGVYVDPGFLTEGFLHRSGGFVFFLPALGLMGLLLFFLRRPEKEKAGRRISPDIFPRE
jgi:exosortase